MPTIKINGVDWEVTDGFKDFLKGPWTQGWAGYYNNDPNSNGVFYDIIDWTAFKTGETTFTGTQELHTSDFSVRATLAIGEYFRSANNIGTKEDLKLFANLLRGFSLYGGAMQGSGPKTNKDILLVEYEPFSGEDRSRDTSSGGVPLGSTYTLKKMNYEDDYSIFDQIVFDRFIIPYLNLYKNPQVVNPTVYSLMKEWLTDPANKKTIVSRFASIAGGSTYQNIELLGDNLEVKPGPFLDALFNTPAEPKKEALVLEGLGIDLMAEKLADDGAFGIGDDEALTIETLNNKVGTEEFAELVAEELGVEATEEVFLNNRQCGLISALLFDDQTDDGGSISDYFKYSGFKSPLSVDRSGNDRIFPVTITGFDPNNLVNYCTVSKLTKQIMIQGNGASGPTDMQKGLWWVYEGKDGSLYEKKIPLNKDSEKQEKRRKLFKIKRALEVLQSDSTKTALAKSYLDGVKVETPLTADTLQRKISELSEETYTFLKEQTAGYYYVEGIRITFDGTNPSTARNDVKVEISMKLSSLRMLKHAIILPSDIPNSKNENNNFKIMDLITLPTTRTTDTNSGDGSYLLNEYKPDYSRLRLKVKAQGDEDSNLILDLATIDHTIGRDGSTGQIDLKINYRGYFESVLNMPYNDALSDDNEITNRENINKKINNLLKKGDCKKPETIRKALRLQQKFATRENRDKKASSLIMRLAANDNIHRYILDSSKVGGLKYYADPTINYVKKIKYGSNTSNLEQKTEALEEALRDTDSSESKKEEARKEIGNLFFFLGDLMYYALDCLYEKDSSTHREHVKNLNLKFIVGTCYVPDPKNINGAPKIINPLAIPVDVSFFVQWFNSFVSNKGISYYPVGTFIKDLIEKLVNNIIYETCFSLHLPDENPPTFRSTFFTDTRSGFAPVKNEYGFFNPDLGPISKGTREGLQHLAGEENKARTGGNKTEADQLKAAREATIQAISSSNNIMLKRGFKIESSKEAKIEESNYCVIYQQFPSFIRQLKNSQGGKKLKDSDHTPTIFYGQQNEEYNFLTNVSFSKTDSPMLREARYFNTNYGNLSLLSNVYDLNFSFLSRKANTLFYPGMILNFILTDWHKSKFFSHPWNTVKQVINPKTNMVESSYDGFGDSNPHKYNKMANIMGMGGYFIVKSVEYDLGETSQEFEIKISTKFLGSDAERPDGRESQEEKKIEENSNCAVLFNELAQKVNPFIDQDQEPIDVAGAEKPEGEKVNESTVKDDEKEGDGEEIITTSLVAFLTEQGKEIETTSTNLIKQIENPDETAKMKASVMKNQLNSADVKFNSNEKEVFVWEDPRYYIITTNSSGVVNVVPAEYTGN